MVQHMSADVSGKQQKYSRIGAQEYWFPLSRTSFQFTTSRTPVKSISGPKLTEKDLVCDVLAGERGPSCNKMAQIPNKKVFYVRFVKHARRGT